MQQNATAAKVRERRMAAGLTIAELSAKTGINRATLYRIEAGQQDPRISTLRRIARHLNTSIYYLTRHVEEVAA